MRDLLSCVAVELDSFEPIDLSFDCNTLGLWTPFCNSSFNKSVHSCDVFNTGLLFIDKLYNFSSWGIPSRTFSSFEATSSILPLKTSIWLPGFIGLFGAKNFDCTGLILRILFSPYLALCALKRSSQHLTFQSSLFRHRQSQGGISMNCHESGLRCHQISGR